MLFTTPLVLNDGTVDHTYDWMYQQPSQMQGVYGDLSADPTLEEQIRSSHLTQRNGRKRHTVSFSGQVALTSPGDGDPSSDPIIISVSVVHHPKHNAADVSKRIAMATDLVAGLSADKLCRGEL